MPRYEGVYVSEDAILIKEALDTLVDVLADAIVEFRTSREVLERIALTDEQRHYLNLERAALATRAGR